MTRLLPRTYLAVPYTDIRAAAKAGARWDRVRKVWYAGPKAQWDQLAKWRIGTPAAPTRPVPSPEEEFADVLRGVGCLVDGPHPIMDGQRHRIAVDTDRGSEKSGFYVAHNDGRPAGYIKNHRTGEEVRWKAQAGGPPRKQHAALRAQAEEHQAVREAAQQRVYEQGAQRVRERLTRLGRALRTPYQVQKGIADHAGVWTDAAGQIMVIPANDIDGRIWTLQTIRADGTKRFAKDCRKEGCFHVVGGLSALNTADVLIVDEGYATSASLSQALALPTVAAFDAGNLRPVAEALRARYPGKPILIAGDDDRHLILTQGANRGRKDAEAAAAAVGGRAIFPVFAGDEADYPSTLAPITPELYRAHQSARRALEEAAADWAEARKAALRAQLLPLESLAALARMKRHTDFNDLARSLGLEAVRRQVFPVVAELAGRAWRFQAS